MIGNNRPGCHNCRWAHGEGGCAQPDRGAAGYGGRCDPLGTCDRWRSDPLVLTGPGGQYVSEYTPKENSDDDQ